MKAPWSWRLSWYTSAWICCVTREPIVPRLVRTSSEGLLSMPRRSERKVGGMVIVATISPFRSSRAASERESRTSLTFRLTRRMVASTSKRWPARVIVCGSPASSTSATRGFELA